VAGAGIAAADVIEGSHIVHDTFVIRYLHDAYTQLRLFARDGRPLSDVALPTLGSIVQVTVSAATMRCSTRSHHSSTRRPSSGTISQTGHSAVLKAPEIAFDPSGYETVQVFYRSKDGTRVPIFLTYRKGLKKDGSNPAYLYGYGVSTSHDAGIRDRRAGVARMGASTRKPCCAAARSTARNGISRDARPQTERLRRLHRRRRVSDRRRLHEHAQARDWWRLERRAADRRSYESTT